MEKGKSHKNFNNSSTASFGMTLRLEEPKSDILKELKLFIGSDKFNQCIANKISLNIEKCSFDNGIQKYLDGYEISPHPDIRRKAATFMVNINSAPDSEKHNYHTHYMSFKKEYEYIKNFWNNNPDYDRAWLPWD